MSPLLLVGILVISSPCLADVKHVLDGTAHPPDPNAINYLASPGNFWWMSSDSPLKAAYEFYKRCAAKGNCPPPTSVGGSTNAPQPFLPAPANNVEQKQPININKNPFLNGQIEGGTGNAHLNPQGTQGQQQGQGGTTGAGGNQVDISKNPFLTGVVTTGNGDPIPKGDGFLGVQPAQPFGGSGSGQKYSADGEQCSGTGRICVERELCTNGIVNKNGEGLIQVRSDVHICREEEVCCKLACTHSDEPQRPLQLPNIIGGPNDLSSITAGKSSVPGSTIKFTGGAGLSPGLIQVIPDQSLDIKPNVYSIGESGHYSNTPKSTRDTSIGGNSAFSSTVDYSDVKFDDVRFASTIRGPAYLPPIGSPTPPTHTADLEVPLSTYQPSIPTNPRPQPPSPPYNIFTTKPAPRPFEIPVRVAGNEQYLPPSPRPITSSVRPYSPTPAPTHVTTSREYLPPISNVDNQYVPQKPSPTKPPTPQIPSITPQRPYQPSPSTPKPFEIGTQTPYQPSPSAPSVRPYPAPTPAPISTTSRKEYAPPQPISPKPTYSPPVVTRPTSPPFRPTACIPLASNNYQCPGLPPRPSPTITTTKSEYLPPQTTPEKPQPTTLRPIPPPLKPSGCVPSAINNYRCPGPERCIPSPSNDYQCPEEPRPIKPTPAPSVTTTSRTYLPPSPSERCTPSAINNYQCPGEPTPTRPTGCVPSAINNYRCPGERPTPSLVRPTVPPTSPTQYLPPRPSQPQPERCIPSAFNNYQCPGERPIQPTSPRPTYSPPSYQTPAQKITTQPPFRPTGCVPSSSNNYQCPGQTTPTKPAGCIPSTTNNYQCPRPSQPSSPTTRPSYQYPSPTTVQPRPTLTPGKCVPSAYNGYNCPGQTGYEYPTPTSSKPYYPSPSPSETVSKPSQPIGCIPSATNNYQCPGKTPRPLFPTGCIPSAINNYKCPGQIPVKPSGPGYDYPIPSPSFPTPTSPQQLGCIPTASNNYQCPSKTPKPSFPVGCIPSADNNYQCPGQTPAISRPTPTPVCIPSAGNNYRCPGQTAIGPPTPRPSYPSPSRPSTPGYEYPTPSQFSPSPRPSQPTGCIPSAFNNYQCPGQTLSPSSPRPIKPVGCVPSEDNDYQCPGQIPVRPSTPSKPTGCTPSAFNNYQCPEQASVGPSTPRPPTPSKPIGCIPSASNNYQCSGSLRPSTGGYEYPIPSPTLPSPRPSQPASCRPSAFNNYQCPGQTPTPSTPTKPAGCVPSADNNYQCPGQVPLRPSTPRYEYPKPTPSFPTRPPQPSKCTPSAFNNYQCPGESPSPSTPRPSYPSPSPTPTKPAGCVPSPDNNYQCPGQVPVRPSTPGYEYPTPTPPFPSRPPQPSRCIPSAFNNYQCPGERPSPSTPRPSYPSPSPTPTKPAGCVPSADNNYQCPGQVPVRPSTPGYEYPKPTPSFPTRPPQPSKCTPSAFNNYQCPGESPSPSTPRPSYPSQSPTPTKPAGCVPSPDNNYQCPGQVPVRPSTPGYEYPTPTPSFPSRPPQPSRCIPSAFNNYQCPGESPSPSTPRPSYPSPSPTPTKPAGCVPSADNNYQCPGQVPVRPSTPGYEYPKPTPSFPTRPPQPSKCTPSAFNNYQCPGERPSPSTPRPSYPSPSPTPTKPAGCVPSADNNYQCPGQVPVRPSSPGYEYPTPTSPFPTRPPQPSRCIPSTFNNYQCPGETPSPSTPRPSKPTGCIPSADNNYQCPGQIPVRPSTPGYEYSTSTSSFSTRPPQPSRCILSAFNNYQCPGETPSPSTPTPTKPAECVPSARNNYQCPGQIPVRPSTPGYEYPTPKPTQPSGCIPSASNNYRCPGQTPGYEYQTPKPAEPSQPVSKPTGCIPSRSNNYQCPAFPPLPTTFRPVGCVPSANNNYRCPGQTPTSPFPSGCVPSPNNGYQCPDRIPTGPPESTGYDYPKPSTPFPTPIPACVPTASNGYRCPTQSTPRPTPFTPQQQTTPRPYQPSASTNGYQYVSSTTPRPGPSNTNTQYIRPSTRQPNTVTDEYLQTSTPSRPSSIRPYEPPVTPPRPYQPPVTPARPYQPPYQPSTQRPYQPPSIITSAPYQPSPSSPRPTQQIYVQTSTPRPTNGYVYQKPTPTFGYPSTTPRPVSGNNINNVFVPFPPTQVTGINPVESGSSNSETKIPTDRPLVEHVPAGANKSPSVYRPHTAQEENNQLPVGCAAALKCVQEIYCTADGFVSPVPVVLTKEQELVRVPTTVCQDLESGIIGKCCRDPNYKDPWPSANLVNGVDDGQYKEDSNLGQYTPDLQRNTRSETGGPRQDFSSTFQSNVQAYAQQPTCGTRNIHSSPPGSGPLDVSFAEIPWQAMILRDSNRSLLCGGAIIRHNAVLTAAHCVEGLETRDVLVKGGEWKLGIDEEPLPFQIVKVSVIVRHPQYQPGSFVNDLALLILEEKLRPTKNVGTICLPKPNEIPTQNCIATGWGKRILQLHAKGAIMHSIKVNVMDTQQCQNTLAANFQQSLTNYSPNTLCGFSDIDQCKVDYGSALACATGPNQYTLSGIFAWDTGCKRDGQIGGYVAPDVDWIDSCLAQPVKELRKLERQYKAQYGRN